MPTSNVAILAQEAVSSCIVGNSLTCYFVQSFRFASSASILRISILELCKDVKTFEPGDVVFDENELALDSKHDIFYIENGVGEWRWTQANPIIELGFTRTMCFTGSGDFYGVTQNLMGTSCARRLSRVLVATSAMSVRVMHLERQRGSCGAILRFQGLSDELSAMAWENIAHGQVSKAADLGLLLQRLILQV